VAATRAGGRQRRAALAAELVLGAVLSLTRGAKHYGDPLGDANPDCVTCTKAYIAGRSRCPRVSYPEREPLSEPTAGHLLALVIAAARVGHRLPTLGGHSFRGARGRDEKGVRCSGVWTP
jgi:hypothetical protein